MRRGTFATAVLGCALLAACASFTLTGQEDARSDAWADAAPAPTSDAATPAPDASEDGSDGGDPPPDAGVAADADADAEDEGAAIVDCTNERCKQTVIICPPGRDCVVRCSGNASCGQVQCPTGHACRIECLTGSTCGGLSVIAGMTNAARVCVRCIGQGSCGRFTCDVRRGDGTDAPCSLDCADGACGPGVDDCAASQCAREACAF